MTVEWDDRLITRHHAADMAGPWDLKIDVDHNCLEGRPEVPVYLRCGQCDGNVTKLPDAGKILNMDGLISAVVRHMTMNHGYALSGASNDG